MRERLAYHWSLCFVSTGRLSNCTHPLVPEHGGFRCDPSPCRGFPHKSSIHFFCEPGYHVNSKVRVSRCRHGRWHPPIPACVPIRGESSVEDFFHRWQTQWKSMFLWFSVLCDSVFWLFQCLILGDSSLPTNLKKEIRVLYKMFHSRENISFPLWPLMFPLSLSLESCDFKSLY